mmetsp:Transcript_6597/g.12277  ORF Transcript_6597/g.12277 Transcript_6597/m.12277 type:complete len:280 (+) Transcript_6597:580-1419(+)
MRGPFAPSARRRFAPDTPEETPSSEPRLEPSSEPLEPDREPVFSQLSLEPSFESFSEPLDPEREPEPGVSPAEVESVVDTARPSRGFAGCSKRCTHMRTPATVCSLPPARINSTLSAVFMTTKPKLPGRIRGCAVGLFLNGFTLECATKTRDTSPYLEKCIVRISWDWKPILVIRRTMKTQRGSSVCISVRCMPRVSFLCASRTTSWLPTEIGVAVERCGPWVGTARLRSARTLAPAWLQALPLGMPVLSWLRAAASAAPAAAAAEAAAAASCKAISCS